MRGSNALPPGRRRSRGSEFRRASRTCRRENSRDANDAAIRRDHRMKTTILGADGKARCRWCAAAPEFLEYHDTEWGFPVADDRRLFEKLSLEGFQSGLSWRTILAKRDNFRAAFREFDFDEVASFTPRDVVRL